MDQSESEKQDSNGRALARSSLISLLVAKKM